MAAQASLKSEQLLFTPSRSEVPIVSPDFRDVARIVSAGSCDVGGVGGAFIFGSGIAQVRAALFFFFYVRFCRFQYGSPLCLVLKKWRAYVETTQFFCGAMLVDAPQAASSAFAQKLPSAARSCSCAAFAARRRRCACRWRRERFNACCCRRWRRRLRHM